MQKNVNGRFVPTNSKIKGTYRGHHLVVEYQEGVGAKATTEVEAPQPLEHSPRTEAAQVPQVQELSAEQPQKDLATGGLVHLTTNPDEGSNPDEGGISQEEYGQLPESLRNELETMTEVPVQETRSDFTAVSKLAWVNRTISVEVLENGEFDFPIPDQENIKGSIRLSLKSPAGGVLHSASYTYAGLKTSTASADKDDTAELVIKADPFQPLALSQTTNPTPYKVRGRVFRKSDGSEVGSKNMFIYAAFKVEGEDQQERLVATTATDASGYFSFEMPAGSLKMAGAQLAGSQEIAQMALTEAGSAQPHQVLVVDHVPDDDANDHSGCGCSSSTPTPANPDATDLVNSTVYSDDLGGHCVDFTTPNRSLEEFDYYMVVRTTEPEIRRIPWEKPPVLNPVIPVTSNPSNAGQAEVSEAFRNLLGEQQQESYDEMNSVGGLFGHLPGYATITPALQNGDHSWWVYGTKMFVFLGEESRRRYGPISGSGLGAGFAALNQIEDLLVSLLPKTAFEVFAKDIARDTFIEFYGRLPYDDNELLTYWLYTAEEYYNRNNRLPKDPYELEDFIRQSLLLTANDGPGEWWLFSLNYDNYNAPGGIAPLQHLKNELGTLYATVYGEAHKLDLELLEFLRLAVSQFKDDYGRIPRTPEELFGYIRMAFESGAGGRMELNGTHPIDWDDTPTLYHNTTISHGHILHYKQVWRADGYSLGDLLYSLPLAPCQKKQIVIHDWDRRDEASRSEFLSADERMSAYLDRDRDVTDILRSTFSEKIKGGSNTKTKGFSIGLGHSGGGGGAAQVPVQGMQFGGVVGSSSGLGMQYSSGNASSTAWQDSARSMSAKGMNQLRENIMQGASAVRNQRSTVVQVVNQGERTSVTTEVIANHNHCHSITMQYFEVLRHLAIEQRLADVQECLFIPMEMKPFDIYKILRWKSELSSSVYDRDLLEGFEALETIEAHYLNTGVQSGLLADEHIQDLIGDLELSMVIARPEDVLNTDGTYDVDINRWNALSSILGQWTAVGIRSHFLDLVQAEREKMFREDILPDILSSFIEELEFGFVDAEGTEHPLKLDVQADSYGRRATGKNGALRLRNFFRDYDPGTPLRLKVRMLPGQRRIARSEIAWFYIKNSHQLPDGSRVSFKGGNLRYLTASLDESLFNVRNQNDDIGATDPATIRTPLNSRELFNPIQDLYDKANLLITHLNNHLEFYHKVIWYQMDADKRFMMLDGVVAPNSGNRSVASVVQNRVVGIVGNNLVMPVARGTHLDPTFAQDLDEPIDLLAHYAPTTPVDPFRISIPTRGVYSEAVMGACNSCEKIDESRHWRFTEVPCGSEPTPIQPVSTDSRYQLPPDLTAKDLPTNIINFQNVPQAPDPASLNNALAAMLTPGIFENLTGLEQNQLNAIQALLANQKGAIEAMRMNTEAATQYAEMAKELAMHNSMVKNADKVIDRTEDQVDKGNITPEEGKGIIKKALQTMGGGADQPIFGSGGNGGSIGSGSVGGSGDGKNVNVSPAKQLLPDNPAVFTSYNASSGSGESVSFTTSGEGGDEPMTTAPAPKPPLELQSRHFFSSNYNISVKWRFDRCLNVPVGTPWHNSYIGIGDIGDHVTKVQEALNQMYPSLNLTVDGEFGPATQQAVRDFQNEFQAGGMLTMVDGVVGPETLRLMDEIMSILEEEDPATITPATVQDIRDKVQRQVNRENGVSYPANVNPGTSSQRAVWETTMHIFRLKRITNRLEGEGKYDLFAAFGSIGGQDSGVVSDEFHLGDYHFDFVTHVPDTDHMANNNAIASNVVFGGGERDHRFREIRLEDNDGNTIINIRVWVNGPFEQDGLKFYAGMLDYVSGRIDFEDLLQELNLN